MNYSQLTIEELECIHDNHGADVICDADMQIAYYEINF